MKPIAILSVDTNPDYLSCIPIVCKSWELQGFDVDLNIVVKDSVIDSAAFEVIQFFKNNDSVQITTWNDKEINPVNPALYAQCLRLYALLTQPDNRYCILGDADMFIASSFLYRDFDKVNSFGHDLTGYGEIPICYVGMHASKWREVMGTAGMEADLNRYSQQHSTEWEKAWGSDQQILTAKLKEYGYDRINFINRGHDPRNSGLPLGRGDRYNWVKPTGEIHDVHMMHNPLHEANFPRIKEMCETVYPAEDWSWLDDFRNDFNKAL